MSPRITRTNKRGVKVPPASVREISLHEGIVQMVRAVSGADKAVDVSLTMVATSQELTRQEKQAAASKPRPKSQERHAVARAELARWVGTLKRRPTVTTAHSHMVKWAADEDGRNSVARSTVGEWLAEIKLSD